MPRIYEFGRPSILQKFDENCISILDPHAPGFVDIRQNFFQRKSEPLQNEREWSEAEYADIFSNPQLQAIHFEWVIPRQFIIDADQNFDITCDAIYQRAATASSHGCFYWREMNTQDPPIAAIGDPVEYTVTAELTFEHQRDAEAFANSGECGPDRFQATGNKIFAIDDTRSPLRLALATAASGLARLIAPKQRRTALPMRDNNLEGPRL